MRYDRTGLTYAVTRQPDSRVAQYVFDALRGMASVCNVGAGTGSYEPSTTVVAVEPSMVMIAQRDSAVPAVQAVAEALPLATDSVDAALGVLTVHHWSDLARGIAEMRRVARRRIVLLTWEPEAVADFWLLRDYLPAASETDRRLAISMDRLLSLLPGASVTPVPIPHDCTDGFGAAFWRRPSAYLDETVRAGMSMLALTPDEQLAEGLSRLRADIDSGAWASRYADLLELDELDVGYRLVVSDDWA